MVAVTAVLLLAVVWLGSAALARHRAQNAADLGSLAAATAAAGGSGDPCAVAREFVDAQPGEAELGDCEVLGTDVRITVTVPVRLGPFGLRDAHARARAGPVA